MDLFMSIAVLLALGWAARRSRSGPRTLAPGFAPEGDDRQHDLRGGGVLDPRPGVDDRSSIQAGILEGAHQVNLGLGSTPVTVWPFLGLFLVAS